MESALEQYLILAKSAKGKAQESIVLQVVNDPNVFVFSELFPLLNEIRKDHKELLEIFAFGNV